MNWNLSWQANKILQGCINNIFITLKQKLKFFEPNFCIDLYKYFDSGFKMADPWVYITDLYWGQWFTCGQTRRRNCTFFFFFVLIILSKPTYIQYNIVNRLFSWVKKVRLNPRISINWPDRLVNSALSLHWCKLKDALTLKLIQWIFLLLIFFFHYDARGCSKSTWKITGHCSFGHHLGFQKKKKKHDF